LGLADGLGLDEGPGLTLGEALTLADGLGEPEFSDFSALAETKEKTAARAKINKIINAVFFIEVE
jgi:hypothetical protein